MIQDAAPSAQELISMSGLDKSPSEVIEAYTFTRWQYLVYRVMRFARKCYYKFLYQRLMALSGDGSPMVTLLVIGLFASYPRINELNNLWFPYEQAPVPRFFVLAFNIGCVLLPLVGKLLPKRVAAGSNVLFEMLWGYFLYPVELLLFPLYLYESRKHTGSIKRWLTQNNAKHRLKSLTQSGPDFTPDLQADEIIRLFYTDRLQRVEVELVGEHSDWSALERQLNKHLCDVDALLPKLKAEYERQVERSQQREAMQALRKLKERKRDLEKAINKIKRLMERTRYEISRLISQIDSMSSVYRAEQIMRETEAILSVTGNTLEQASVLQQDAHAQIVQRLMSVIAVVQDHHMSASETMPEIKSYLQRMEEAAIRLNKITP